MKYGFIIDNRKCIGCHACTTACKSEHEVPIGVNRTWVKQVEKGEFPNTRRLFSVMRCNHCTDAPCVEICPTEALFFRNDGIVDFDKDRCIGCKSCMQACPYDALYIDPETHTAAKCNYCAHRIDIGLEPACVNVCPEEAIISGDMDNPNSKISQLLAQQPVKARKPEKGTVPNLFYIDADDVSILPSATEKTGEYIWSEQETGVGHFAKEAEKMAFTNSDVVSAVMEMNGGKQTVENAKQHPQKSVEVLMGKEARRVYDTPDKGVLWGWEVSAYVWTKAISAGVILLCSLAYFLDIPLEKGDSLVFIAGFGISFIFLILTGILLIKDLDQPKRFLYVLLRPHWESWLVKGAYAITLFGGLLSLLFLIGFLKWNINEVMLDGILILLTITGVIVAIYTAFLFAQAKGRDFWQSPMLSIHMLLHSLMAGAAIYAILTGLNAQAIDSLNWKEFLEYTLLITIAINLTTIFIELKTTHSTLDAQRTVAMILKGRYRKLFWFGVILMGNVLPFLILIFGNGNEILGAGTGVLVLIGLYLTNHIWVEAPQRIPLA